MYLTEEDARGKICPKLIRAFDMSTFEVSYHSCIASECMEWRWGTAYETGECDDDLTLMDEQGTKGYCGLGGKP
jgi:hypothetical protein